MEQKKQILNNNFYFTIETDKAIIEYNNCNNDTIKRNKLFNNIIHPAFDKLCENIINTYKFYNTGYEYETLKHDTISFLVEKMIKYNPNLNVIKDKSLAYSYFGTIAKNYLIQQTIKKSKVRCYNDLFHENDYEINVPDTIRHDNDSHGEFITALKEKLEEKLSRHFDDIKYKKFIQGLNFMIEIITNHKHSKYPKQELLVNKKHLKFYLKEITSLSDSEITKYLNKSKKEFMNRIYQKYIEGVL